MSSEFKKHDINYFKEPEHYRTYTFDNGYKITYNNVIGYCETESGKHILECEDGLKHIISNKWIAIEICVENWT